MRVVSTHWSADRLTVRLHVDHGTEEKSDWQLRFTNVVDYLFADVYSCGLNVWVDDHPAIQQYVQTSEYLHFAAAPEDSHHVVGELWAAHRELADDWIPFDRYLNLESPLDQLLASGSGLLATGPAFLIAAYSDVLEKEGCRPTRTELPAPRFFQTATMTHFGESYVIAEHVSARKLSSQGE